MQINAADQLQMIQRKIYAACLQTRAKQGASRMTTPRAGTNTTNAGTFVTFDVPGATATNPQSINNPGAITGSYFDAGALEHSFLRTSDGTITPFDPPGTTCISSNFPSCSAGFGINPAGTIVGTYDETAVLLHGFLRAPNGTFTVFDPPSSKVTMAFHINPDGVVAGDFFTSATSFVAHGFVRAPNGTFTTFDPLGSTFTQPNAINPAGTVTGQFFDVSGDSHGFLRTSDGTITVFDPPGSVLTSSNAINPAGTVVGLFETTPTFPVGVHGFLRAPNGTITVFDAAPGAIFTNPQAISPGGTIVGFFVTTPDFSAAHGFLRAPNGTITVFDPPGSLFTVIPGGGAMNPAGTVTGFFMPPDSSAQHGFVARLKNVR
jgi:uncharacterized membrane protein